MANKTMHHVVIGSDTFEIVDQYAREHSVTDTTLAISGAPADAKTVGDRLALKADDSDVTALDTRVTAVEGEIDALSADIDECLTEQANLLKKCEIVEIPASANKWDKDTASVGLMHTTGVVYTGESYDNYRYNGIGEVSEGDTISGYEIYKGVKTTIISRVIAFDGNGTVLPSEGKINVSSYTVPAGVASLSITVSASKVDYFMALLNAESAPESYIPYAEGDSYYVGTPDFVPFVGNPDDLSTTDKSTVVGAINEINGGIPDFPITPRDTDFFHIPKNLINPDTCVSGEYVVQITGAFAEDARHCRTDYVEVEPSTEYVVRGVDGAPSANFRYVFYTENKTYISGAVGALASMLLTSPASAKYMVISDALNVAHYMIAPYVDGDKSYEASDNVYVLPEYIKETMDDVLLNVPSKIYALVGFETNIYFENITEKWDKYDWDVTCTKGQQLERGYRITPTVSDVGTYTLTIRASLSESIYKEVTTTLVVTSASAGSGQTKSVIVLGDSTTNNGIAVTKLNQNFADDVMGITTLGTRGTAPNNHEGRSGWTFYAYFNPPNAGDIASGVENPWYNPNTQTFDASYYFANSEIAKPDYFIINLGINDVFGYATDSAYEAGVTTILERAETAVQSVLDATTTTKVCVCLTIPPNHSQDAFGKAYYCNQTRNRYKRNNTLWVNALINQFKDRESERIYLIPINACLDTVYNMGMETLPVNARNTGITYQSPILNGGVHPVESGYWQIADVYTAFIKANL